MLNIDFFKQPLNDTSRNEVLIHEASIICRKFIDAGLTIIGKNLHIWYYDGRHEKVFKSTYVPKFYKLSMVSFQMKISGKNHKQKIKDAVKNMQPKNEDSSYSHLIITQESNDKFYDIITIRQINNNAQFKEFQIAHRKLSKKQSVIRPNFEINKQSVINELRAVTTDVADSKDDFEERLDAVATKLIQQYSAETIEIPYEAINYINGNKSSYGRKQFNEPNSKYLYYGVSSLMNYADQNDKILDGRAYGPDSLQELPNELTKYIESFL